MTAWETYRDNARGDALLACTYYLDGQYELASKYAARALAAQERAANGARAEPSDRESVIECCACMGAEYAPHSCGRESGGSENA